MNRKKPRKKRQKLMNNKEEINNNTKKESDDNNGYYEDDGVKVTLLAGKVPIDLNRKHIKKFLNCGICNNLLK